MKERVLSIPDKLPQLSPDVFRLMGDVTFPAMANTDQGWHETWIDGIKSNWSTFRTLALQVLSSNREPAGINLLPNNDGDLGEEFTLTKPEIRDKVVRMRGKDLKYVYRYFELGVDEGESDDGEPMLRITRKELLQLYVAAFARKYLVLRYDIPDIVDEYPIRNSADGEGKFEDSRHFAHWDKFLRVKPERGGPLLNAR